MILEVALDGCPGIRTFRTEIRAAARSPKIVPVRPRHDERVTQCWRGIGSRTVQRVRRDGRAAVLWSSRITIAATARYGVASLLFPGTKPLLPH